MLNVSDRLLLKTDKAGKTIILIKRVASDVEMTPLERTRTLGAVCEGAGRLCVMSRGSCGLCVWRYRCCTVPEQ